MNISFSQGSPGWMSGSVECSQLPSAMASQNHDHKIITNNNCLHNYCRHKAAFSKCYYFYSLFSKARLVLAGHLHHWNTISHLFLQALRLQFKFIRQVTLTVSEKCYFLQLIKCFVAKSNGSKINLSTKFQILQV